MPRKKVKKTEKKFNSAKRISKSLVNLDSTKSYTSLFYGALSVIVLLILVYVGFRILSQVNKNQRSRGQNITSQSAKTSPEQVNEKGEKLYTVQLGDNLWTISEKYYKSGYNWVDIAKANKLVDANQIDVNTKLVIPNVEPKTLTMDVKGVTDSTLNSTDKITGGSYTVKRGDNLWEISVRAYGDGFKWTQIAKTNNLVNPSLIHAGNVFKIPRLTNSS